MSFFDFILFFVFVFLPNLNVFLGFVLFRYFLIRVMILLCTWYEVESSVITWVLALGSYLRYLGDVS